MKHSRDTNSQKHLAKIDNLPDTLNKIERKIYVASVSQIKFKDFTYVEEVELSTILAEWSTHLQVEVDETTIEFIIQFIKSNFPTYNNIDIKYTMNLAISGKLGELNFYGKFSTVYVADAIQKYRSKFRGKAIVDARQKIVEEQLNQSLPEKDSLYYFKENLKFAFEDAKKNMFYDYGGTIYKFLADNGLAKVPFNVFADADMYAQQKLKEETRKLALSQTVTNSKYQKINKDYLKTILVRQYCVNYWLKSFSDKEVKKFLETIKVEPKEKK